MTSNLYNIATRVSQIRPRAVAPDLCLQEWPRNMIDRGLIISLCIYDKWTASQVRNIFFYICFICLFISSERKKVNQKQICI